ncbi:MAG TPA: hypothetical protein VLE02_01995 [Nitrosarchaeum sp.]|nr:hypothetical protein [Nitrosarchaeum sp.]
MYSDDDLSDEDLSDDDMSDEDLSDDEDDELEEGSFEEEYQASYKDLQRVSAQSSGTGGISKTLDKFQKISQTPIERFESSLREVMYNFELDVNMATQNKIIETAKSLPNFLYLNPKLVFLAMHYFSNHQDMNKTAITGYLKYLDDIPPPDFIRYLNLLRNTN